MAVNRSSGSDYDDSVVDTSGIENAVVDAAREAGRTFNNCFCWNCGYGVKLAKVMPCPRCGAMMNGPTRFLSPCVPQPYVRVTASHPSIRRHNKSKILGAFIFAILFSIGLSIFMVTQGELDFDGDGMHSLTMILAAIWLLWIVWLVYDFGSLRKKINNAGRYNQSSGEMDIYCAICRYPSDRRANYCGLCGCIIPK